MKAKWMVARATLCVCLVSLLGLSIAGCSDDCCDVETVSYRSNNCCGTTSTAYSDSGYYRQTSYDRDYEYEREVDYDNGTRKVKIEHDYD